MAITVIPDHVHRRAPRLGPATRKLGQAAASAIFSAGRYVVAPHRASLKRLTEIPLTVLSFSAGDFAAFHVAHGWGWLAIGVSLFVLEHIIADPE
jgi:hypothetical protein